jgi:hypothetical protein
MAQEQLSYTNRKAAEQALRRHCGHGCFNEARSAAQAADLGLLIASAQQAGRPEVEAWKRADSLLRRLDKQFGSLRAAAKHLCDGAPDAELANQLAAWTGQYAALASKMRVRAALPVAIDYTGTPVTGGFSPDTGVYGKSVPTSRSGLRRVLLRHVRRHSDFPLDAELLAVFEIAVGLQRPVRTNHPSRSAAEIFRDDRVKDWTRILNGRSRYEAEEDAYRTRYQQCTQQYAERFAKAMELKRLFVRADRLSLVGMDTPTHSAEVPPEGG